MVDNPFSARRYLGADRVVTGDGGVIVDGVVCLEGSRIVGVGPREHYSEELRRGSVDQFDGCTIIPGLIDAHCHLTLAGDKRTYEQMAMDSDEMFALVGARNMQRHLRSGVTTLRDNGGRNKVTFIIREAIERGYLIGPRLLLAGRPLTPSGGHFHWCNGVADGRDAMWAAVRTLVSEGADHIKLMASGGATVGSIPYLASYGVDELMAAVEAAHSLGRLTTAHCRARQSMANAVDAGLDCIEHAEFLIEGKRPEGGRGLSASILEYDQVLADRLIASNAFVSFTFQAGGYDTFIELKDKLDREGLSSDERRLLRSLSKYYEMKTEIFSRLLSDGVLPKLVISTDAGCSDSQFGRMHYGFRLAVLGGMDPLQVIESATRVAAQACGVSDIVGTVAAGKEADLVVVRGNPLRDLADRFEVEQVFKAGCIVPDPSSNATLAHSVLTL